MSKVIDETWEQNGHQLQVADETSAEWVADFCEYGIDAPPGFQPIEAARARLAAQAPAMARLLVAREWTPHYEGDYCQDCGAPKRYWQPEDRPGDGHLDDCRFVAVLRAAGVLE